MRTGNFNCRQTGILIVADQAYQERGEAGLRNELNAPSVRALKIFDIAQVTTTKTLQFRHAVLGPG
jgi:hypothetical protein